MTSKEKGHGKPWGSKARCPVGWASAVEDKGLSLPLSLGLVFVPSVLSTQGNHCTHSPPLLVSDLMDLQPARSFTRCSPALTLWSAGGTVASWLRAGTLDSCAGAATIGTTAGGASSSLCNSVRIMGTQWCPPCKRAVGLK